MKKRLPAYDIWTDVRKTKPGGTPATNYRDAYLQAFLSVSEPLNKLTHPICLNMVYLCQTLEMDVIKMLSVKDSCSGKTTEGILFSLLLRNK